MPRSSKRSRSRSRSPSRRPQIKPPQIKPPPPPPPEAQKPPPPKQPPPNMVMVEVKDDKNVKDKAPDDAKQLSDKNRDVAEETRATKTNLDKESEGKAEASQRERRHEVGRDRWPRRQDPPARGDEADDRRARQGDRSLRRQGQVAKGVIQGERRRQRRGRHRRDRSRASCRCAASAAAATIVDQKNDGKKIGKKGLPGLNTHARVPGLRAHHGQGEGRRRAPGRRAQDVEQEGPLGAQARRDQELARELRPRRSPRQPDRAQDARASVRALRRAHAPPHPRAVGLRLPRGSRQQGRGLSAQQSRTCG